MLKTGDMAPDFKLPSSEGGDVTLEDLKGSWAVMYFYPKDMTPGCTVESCDFKDLHKEFDQMNARVLGVSPDSLKSHEKFIEKHSLPFELLSDESKEMLEAYGVWQQKSMFGKKYMGIVRTTVLINPDGKIDNVWNKVKVGGHAEEVLETLRAAMN